MTRNGKWILEYDGDNECDNLYKCSMCGFECGCEEYDKPNFCPNCGTDMRIDDRVTMTREEAIQILSTRDAHGVLCGYTSGVTEALDMAIEALKFAKHFDLLKEYQSLQEVVRCNDCRYQRHCYQTVSHNKTHDGFKEYWSEPIDFCSKGERKEP